MRAKCPCCGTVLEYEALKKGEIENRRDRNRSTLPYYFGWGFLLLPFFGIGLFIILMGVFATFETYIPQKTKIECDNCGRIFEVPAY